YYEFGERYGIECLLHPILRPTLLLLYPWWWSNVFLAFGVWCVLRREVLVATILGAIATIIALSLWIVRDPKYSGPLPMGYWYWVFSSVLLSTLPVIMIDEAPPRMSEDNGNMSSRLFSRPPGEGDRTDPAGS